MIKDQYRTCLLIIQKILKFQLHLPLKIQVGTQHNQQAHLPSCFTLGIVFIVSPLLKISEIATFGFNWTC